MLSIESLFERQGRCEEKLAGHDRRINNLEMENRNLSRLTTLVEMQMEINKEQQEQMKEQHQTLLKVNDNLTGLNNSQQKLNENQEQLSVRVSDIESTLQSHNINAVQIFKKSLGYIVTLAGGVIAAYVYMKLGL
ncbi:hypothetical protein EVU96_00010 [Bacillus infantis]|uniref:hypothetical protein n=1 Tax=Bacillus infantis TaxID=324767 RepID=UPI00101CF29C|nr:hypothetical protein [Bacillus infantis]RYI32028.1 hypothetical protein EVU96_00010 [Bacillus infantis]